MTPRATEEQLIAAMVARVPTPPAPAGPGDDCALSPPTGRDASVVTTDLMVEGVHFLRAHPPRWLGHKLLAANLSDVASMGARPTSFVVSAALPQDMPLGWWEALADGLGVYARAAEVQLVGGDVVASPGPVMLGVTAWGRLEGERGLRRDQGRVGDTLMVLFAQGAGRSGQGLSRWLERAPEGWADPSLEAELGADPCLVAHLKPTPDLEAGPWALAHGATAGMDLSDGLATDLPRLARASDLSLVLDLDALPPDPACGDAAADERVAGGEDYGLVVLVPAEQVASFASRGFYALGKAVAGSGVVWYRNGSPTTLRTQAFRHFDAES